MRRGTRGTNGYSARAATHCPSIRALPTSPRGSGSALIDLRGPPARIHDGTAQELLGNVVPPPAGPAVPARGPAAEAAAAAPGAPASAAAGKGSASPTGPATRFA